MKKWNIEVYWYNKKMINFNDFTWENLEEHNEKWPEISNQP